MEFLRRFLHPSEQHSRLSGSLNRWERFPPENGTILMLPDQIGCPNQWFEPFVGSIVPAARSS